ncbi:bifunctional adenosylcobinamide kinase/adenosylcobinamide-phosphate guanylyltransferase [Swingsia samuiensis]|uniref:bifunctional adenosylcobinamide kinase/adenosylcobinamide-phosphate guanylyltransferase n=1 Tax=Swingsia samuiensis TaxID=1293412 RepID=UPI001FEB150F|nr:bifunctional adenosylcobinamide kinase/adenosylcobinamide-phosphate guanylyltransferase [Swingsia samuiensis]
MVRKEHRISLVLGGARSGKSRIAESIVTTYPKPWLYLATGRAFDQEMQDRIVLHQQAREVGWQTFEEPFHIAQVLNENLHQPILVDCLTLWLTNLLLEEKDVHAETTKLLEAVQKRSGPTVFVGNEVGLSIVPENRLVRRFRDEAGLLHQKIGSIADQVLFVAAGFPITLKS